MNLNIKKNRSAFITTLIHTVLGSFLLFPCSAEPLDNGPVVKMFRFPFQANLNVVTSIQYVDRDMAANSSITTWNGSSRSYDGHEGVDFAAPRGTPVVAAASGTVQGKSDGYIDNRTSTGSNDGGGFGNYVILDHGGGV